MNRFLLLLSFILILSSCKVEVKDLTSKTIENNDKVKVLNLGVFHMGETSDAHKTEFDESKNRKEIKDICFQISKFKPTIIFVEREPSFNEDLKLTFNRFKKDPSIQTNYSGEEIQLLAFEIGRLAKTKAIFGFDHQLACNYNFTELANKIKAKDYIKIKQNLIKQAEGVDKINTSLKKTLLEINQQKFYDFLFNINADLLTYVNSKDSFEGADEAAKFYQRNLRMFANINKVNTNKSDRILIISGAAHAAFLNEFMKRSPKYELEDIKKYLN